MAALAVQVYRQGQAVPVEIHDLDQMSGGGILVSRMRVGFLKMDKTGAWNCGLDNLASLGKVLDAPCLYSVHGG
jgi:hypothetical protein